MNITKYVKRGGVLVGVKVKDWEEAVRISGKLLLDKELVEPQYVEAMINVVKELGPYSVVAPGVALPHARPEDGARSVGISIVILDNEVNFGSPNDPVKVIIAFASPDKTSHLELLRDLANMLSNDDILEKLKSAKSEEELIKILEEQAS